MNNEDIVRIRKELGVSQSTLAENIVLVMPFRNSSPEHLNRETVGRYERGIQPIPEWYEAVLNWFQRHGFQHVSVGFSPSITSQKRDPSA